jgi:(1->4)-alpha-D-glucan 1-alpha-D-glucosylmutase
VPLDVSGARRECLFAFARTHGPSMAIACVPRMIAALMGDRPDALGRGTWENTRVELPTAFGVRRWREAFTGALIQAVEDERGVALDAAEIFEHFPVALLTTDG